MSEMYCTVPLNRIGYLGLYPLREAIDMALCRSESEKQPILITDNVTGEACYMINLGKVFRLAYIPRVGDTCTLREAKKLINSTVSRHDILTITKVHGNGHITCKSDEDSRILILELDEIIPY